MLDKIPGVASAINILNASTIAEKRLQELSRVVGRSFGLHAFVSPASLNLDRAFDPSRGQYNSTALLAQLVKAVAGSDEKKIAIVGVDLFIPVLTFVFGEAQLNGVAAVVSSHRLANPFYGLPRDDELAFQRLEKEIGHEIGPTSGLYHCHQFECVMRSSTYVEEIDLKRVTMCRECSEKLQIGR